MIDAVKGILDEFACRELSLTIDATETPPSLLVLLRGATIKYHESADFDVEELILTIVNPFPAKDDPARPALVIERLKLTFGSRLLNRLFLRFEAECNKNSLFQPRAFFIDGRVVLRAVYHKGIDIPISMELTFSALGNNIRIDISGVQLSDFIPIPNLITKVIMSIAKRYLDSNAIVVEDEYLIIDVQRLCPFPLAISLTDARVEGEQLVVEAL